MAGTGFELSEDSSGNATIANQSGAKCGALGEQNRPIDQDLAAVIQAWPTLPAALKAGILAMVKAAKIAKYAK